MAPEQLGDDLGVERGAAVADPMHGFDEVGDVGDAVLEQVADALGVGREELPCVLVLHVLREHEHAQAGVPAARLDRCS